MHVSVPGISFRMLGLVSCFVIICPCSDWSRWLTNKHVAASRSSESFNHCRITGMHMRIFSQNKNLPGGLEPLHEHVLTNFTRNTRDKFKFKCFIFPTEIHDIIYNLYVVRFWREGKSGVGGGGGGYIIGTPKSHPTHLPPRKRKRYIIEQILWHNHLIKFIYKFLDFNVARTPICSCSVYFRPGTLNHI